MRKFNLLALALIATLVAVPAFASVQNVKISGDIDSTYVNRANFDLGNSAGDQEEQHLFITQTRLRVDADLTDNVSATVALINEREWAANSTNTGVDLNLAYVTLREMLYSPLTVIIGRQDWRYGNSFVFDSAGTNNSAPGDSDLSGVAEDLTKQTALDAVRVILDYNPLTIEAFYSRISGTATLSDLETDKNVMGIYTTYDLGDDLNSSIEAYYFYQEDRSTKSGTTSNTGREDTIHLPGIRISTNPLDGLALSVEGAMQRGIDSIGAAGLTQERNASAAQLIANYQVPAFEEYNPVLQYVYTYVSGNADTQTSDHNAVNTAWDPFFENQATGKIYNTLFNLSGAHIHEVSLTVNPMEDVTSTFSWTGLSLVNELSSTSTFALAAQPDGSGVPSYTNGTDFKSGEDQIGNEFDIVTTYDYTEDVQIGLNVGWFVPGDLFIGTNQQTASQALVNVNVNF